MKKIILSLVLIFILVGCNTDPNDMIPESEMETQYYSYEKLKGSKSDIWEKGIDHITSYLGYNSPAFRVKISDKALGLLTGKGVIDWPIGPDSWKTCRSQFEMYFIVVKDNKANVSLKLTQAISTCRDLERPSRHGYGVLLKKFSRISKSFEAALREEEQQK